MFNAADQREVRKAKQRERHEHERDLKDLRDVLSTKQGRRFVWRQLSQAGCFRLSFAYGEPETTAFNEGRRSLGLALMAEIHELDAALYVQMANEANREEQIDSLAKENTEAATTESTTEEKDDA